MHGLTAGPPFNLFNMPVAPGTGACLTSAGVAGATQCRRRPIGMPGRRGDGGTARSCPRGERKG